jgi:hypothetical protein
VKWAEENPLTFGAAGATGATGAVGISKAQTDAFAAQQRGGVGQGEAAFAAKPSFAIAPPTGDSGGAGGGVTMKIQGDLKIVSPNPMLNGQFATMVAEVINSAQVRKQMEKGGLLSIESS